jgi:hypothetical protein
VIGALVAAILAVGCSRGPYADLERAFEAEKQKAAKSVRVAAVVLVSPRHKGADNYKNMMDVSLSDAGIAISPKSPFMKPVLIPVSAIVGCSKKCFGESQWDADIMIGSPPVEVSFESSVEMIEWCWKNRVPVISTQHRQDWMYRGKPLVQSREHLMSRGRYDEALRQRCLGY